MNKELSRYDLKLIDGAAAGKSPNELSALVGGTLSPAECVVRVRKILEDKDVWTGPERRKLMLHRAYSTVDELADLSRTSQDSKDYGTLVRAMDLLRKVLGEQSQATEEELQRLVRAQAAQMMMFISAAMDRAAERLGAEFPEISPSDIGEALQGAMAEVSGEEL